MPTLTERVKALEDQLTALTKRPVAVIGGVTNADVNAAVANGIGPLRQRLDGLENRVEALEAIIKTFNAILLAKGVKASEVNAALKVPCQHLTRDQRRIVRDILQSA